MQKLRLLQRRPKTKGPCKTPPRILNIGVLDTVRSRRTMLFNHQYYAFSLFPNYSRHFRDIILIIPIIPATIILIFPLFPWIFLLFPRIMRLFPRIILTIGPRCLVPEYRQYYAGLISPKKRQYYSKRIAGIVRLGLVSSLLNLGMPVPDLGTLFH